MTPDAILSLIRARLWHPDLIARLDADATFDELRLNTVDAWGIACEIEEATGRELDWNAVQKWATVADVIGTVGKMETV